MCLSLAMPEEIPNDVRRLLMECFDSVEQLSIMLLLRSTPNQVWTVSQISRELRSSEASIEQRLKDLYARKMLRPRPDGHSFMPNSDELVRLMSKIAELNKIMPYRLIEIIYSQRNQVPKAFADAFKIRGDKS